MFTFCEEKDDCEGGLNGPLSLIEGAGALCVNNSGPATGPDAKNGVVVWGAPVAPEPARGPEDLKGVELCEGAENGEAGLPGKFVGLSPPGCIFANHFS